MIHACRLPSCLGNRNIFISDEVFAPEVCLVTSQNDKQTENGK